MSEPLLERGAHEALKSFFSALIKALLILIGLCAIAFAFFIYSNTAKFDVFRGCEARRIEHALAFESRTLFMDFCMGEHGYWRSSSCPSDSVVFSTCYLPRWAIWAE